MMMKSRQIILAGIIIIALLSSTGTVVALGTSSATVHGAGSISGSSTPDNRSIGPESPLFGQKVAREDIDETFTFNDIQRVEKQIDHTQTRIEEVRQELELNQAGYAEKALELYSQKLNRTEISSLRFQSDSTGLLHAQELIARHQTLLAISCPDTRATPVLPVRITITCSLNRSSGKRPGCDLSGSLKRIIRLPSEP
jgi:hypothetical protein